MIAVWTVLLLFPGFIFCGYGGGYAPSPNKYPYLPAPPGKTPPCAKYGATFCTQIDTYPTETIRYLLYKWGRTYEQFIKSETKDDFFLMSQTYHNTYGGYGGGGGYDYGPVSYHPTYENSHYNNSYIEPPISPSNYYGQTPPPPPQIKPQTQQYPQQQYPQQEQQPAFNPNNYNQYQNTQQQYNQDQNSQQQHNQHQNSPQQYNQDQTSQNSQRQYNQQPHYQQQQSPTTQQPSFNLQHAAAAIPPIVQSYWWNHRETGENGNGRPAFPHIVQHQRRRTKRQAAPEGEQLCTVRTQYTTPKAAMNSQGNWMYVVNMEEDKRYVQQVKTESCTNPDTACNNVCTLPPGYRSNCRQKYVQKRLVALAGTGDKLEADVFWFPSCCICQINGP